ncbi:MAG: DoxX family protein [candidate division KSB1 bacterium]|nr:DoxX family protein [candidate division KSB1 bacterium]MDZ7368677.1 DoxX family protein [candidate division KSB1 bacterium]MDZ7406492.1 DoxX family protein [candidate division KSB1 bacterium]
MESINEQRLKDFIYQLVSIYFGIDFIVWGVSNFTSDYDFDTRFGYPAWIQIPIGISETLAGVGLLHPRTNLAALLILASVMAGAVYSHLSAQDGGYGTPLKYLLYFAAMLYYKIRQTSRYN